MKKIILPVIILALFFTQCGNDDNTVKGNDSSQLSVNQNIPKKKKAVTFKASTENVVEAGEIFQVKFEVNADPDNFNPPDFGAIDVISGPMTSSFSSTQWINGKSSQTVTSSYSYNISCPDPGTYKIKPAEVIVDGNTYKTDTLTIKVVGEQPTRKNNKSISKSKKQKINTKEDIFIRTDFSKTSVYNGEYITVTTKIYTKTDFQNISELKFPDFSGFWTKPLEEPRQLNFHNELINGKKYSVALLKKTLLFAVKPGKFTVSPYVISLQLKKKDGKMRDFFGNIVDHYKLINKRLHTKKQTIVVKPLPQPVPGNFSGFTGNNVSVKAEIDTHSFRTDESANLKITISGTGNLYLLTDFNLRLPDGLKHFKPETELKDKYTEYGEVGDRIFNFIITADSTGTFTIPSVDFVYFNSDKQSYETLKTKPLTLNVAGGKAYNPESSERKTLSNKDIRYIKDSVTGLKKTNSAFVGSVFFYSAYLVMLILFIVVLYFRNKYLKANADSIAVRKKKAGKISQKRLKSALKYMNEKDDKAFYKEIMTAIWGYLSDKLSVNSDELTTESIQKLLSDKNIDKELVNKITGIIDICGYAQYSPAGEEAKPEIIYKETEAIINELEEKL